MKTNGGFLVTKIKQLGDRIFEKILSEKNIDAFNGAQGRILYVLWQEDGISIRSLSVKCGLAITSLTTMLERMEHQGLISRVPSETDMSNFCCWAPPSRTAATASPFGSQAFSPVAGFQGCQLKVTNPPLLY